MGKFKCEGCECECRIDTGIMLSWPNSCVIDHSEVLWSYSTEPSESDNSSNSSNNNSNNSQKVCVHDGRCNMQTNGSGCERCIVND